MNVDPNRYLTPEEKTLLKKSDMISWTVIGGMVGGAAAFCLTAAYCWIMAEPQPTGQPDPYLAVGWVYLFYTVPRGLFLGCVIGSVVGYLRARRWRSA